MSPSSHARSAHESRILEPGIVVGQFGSSLFGKVIQTDSRSLEHPAHGSPIGKFGDQASHDNLFALHIESNLGTWDEV